MTYKILIVDDEPANLRSLERLFRTEYDVLTAGSGPEALDLLRQHDVALLITDQRMPEMTGVDFFEMIYIQHYQSKYCLSSFGSLYFQIKIFI